MDMDWPTDQVLHSEVSFGLQVDKEENRKSYKAIKAYYP